MLTRQEQDDLIGLINACLNTDCRPNEGGSATLTWLAAVATRLRDLEAKYNTLVPGQEADRI